MISGIIFSVAIIAVIYIVYVVAPQRELQAKARILELVLKYCDEFGTEDSRADKEQVIQMAMDTLGFPNPKDKDKTKDEDNDK